MQLISAIGTLFTLGVALILWDLTQGGWGVLTLLGVALFVFCGAMLFRYRKPKE